jgi:GTP-binding protein HflX
MIDAFKSTLDELKYANLILLVLDVSESTNEIEAKYASSLDVINEFEVPPTRIVYVLNKVDATNVEEAFDKAGELGILDTKSVVPVSAKTGFNIDQLRSVIRLRLFEDTSAEHERSESAPVNSTKESKI